MSSPTPVSLEEDKIFNPKASLWSVLFFSFWPFSNDFPNKSEIFLVWGFKARHVYPGTVKLCDNI